MSDAPENPKPSKGKGPLMTLIIVLVVAVLEGGAFFAVIQFMGGGPQTTYGAEDEHMLQGEVEPESQASAEVVLLQSFKVPNNKSGVTIIYDFDISVAVPESRAEEFKAFAEKHNAQIRDRVFQIIRQARPRVLEEDDFGTLRKLLQHALSEIAGDESLVQRVLIPRCLPLQTG